MWRMSSIFCLIALFTALSKEFDQSKSPRVQLQRLSTALCELLVVMPASFSELLSFHVGQHPYTVSDFLTRCETMRVVDSLGVAFLL